MSYDDPAQAVAALEDIYASQLKSAERYAVRESANQAFVDQRYEELTRFHAALGALQTIDFDPYWGRIVKEIAGLTAPNSTVQGVILRIDLAADVKHHQYFHLKYYGAAAS